MTRFTATDRLARLLAVVPWVAAQPDGAALDEVAARFGYPVTQLVADLQEVLVFVGVHPYTPDTLIEVAVEGDRVFIEYADWFTRPLRLDPEQALALLAAGRTVLAMTGDDDGPLLRALTKLGTALGAADTGGQPVEIRLGTASEETLAVLRRAVGEHRVVDLDYYSYGSDVRTRRTVEPHRFYADQGNWYLAAHCRTAGGDRVFRLDRMREVRLTEETFPAPVASTSRSPVDFATRDLPVVVLDVDASARWIADQYPVREVTDAGDGRLAIALTVTARPWLERLLLRLGSDARVVEGPDDLAGDLAAEAARRVLGRYPEAGTSTST